MNHVKMIINQLKQKQTQATTAASATLQDFDLPGDHRMEKIRAEKLRSVKHQYNSCLKWLRAANRMLKQLKGKDKKKERDDKKREIVGHKGHLNDLLARIGTYSDEERLHGFKEADNGD